MACLGRTLPNSRVLPEPPVPPRPAERTEAQRDRLISASAAASGSGDTSPSSGCPCAQLPSPAWHTSEGKGCHERGWGTLRKHMALTGTLPLLLLAVSQEGPQQLRAVPWGAAHGGSPCTSSQCWGTGDAFATGSPGAAGLGRAASLAGSGGVTWQPRPRGQAPGSRAALPVCAGPSIRHAALSAGSLLSPRQ